MQLNGTFDVKLGKSFMDPSSATYMTMRCDFMPASVDRTQPGTIKVDEGKELVVNLPNVASVGAGSTVFRGSARPVQKECMLIYNKRTGELTLERIAYAVQLKKTREECKPTHPATTTTGSADTQSDAVQSASHQHLTDTAADGSSSSSLPNRKPTDPVLSKPPTTGSKTRTLSSSSSSSSGSSTSGSSESSAAGGGRGQDANEEYENKSSPAGGSVSSDMDDSTDEEGNTTDGDSDSVSDSSSLSAGRPRANDKPPTSSVAALPQRSSVHDTFQKKATTSSGPTNHPTNSRYLPAHRKLIEHDLKLSDSDSDDMG
ncbi:hypothetical protein EG68_06848 [Paragonimus skrjabini miyazakii]|uniref:Transcription elongation factor Eaf N-terminal domain-containing protein n=1 Tax=Paragonimus skrjabini miyazakii TaxID=59628 RepID=A0A8S9YU07_9TREM|nr:hypothetical protein EG68_06848 [Paragonimus skrjabini miyazakii]